MSDDCDKRIRVLLVDDDRDDYLLTQELFSDMDSHRYQMDWVADYDSALASIERGEHDVYLLDYRLGGRSGLDLLREAIKKNSKAPAILLTGQGEREVDLEAMKAGAADYLDKGRLDAAALDRSIRHALQRRQEQQELERRVNESTAELSESGKQLRQLAADMSESDRRKNEFLAILAQELRNPLAPMRNALQILQLKANDENLVRTASEMLDRQISHMTRMVDDLLDINRIARGSIKLHRERVDLVALVNQVVEAANSQIQCMGRDVNVALPWDPLHVNADPARLAQVIGNLLTNACKFTDKSGFISLSLEQDGDYAVISLRDSGIGIASRDLPHVFDMFMQADNSPARSSHGLGLGLSLVKTLVEMHGGTVGVQSTGVGKGSEFVVRLPLFPERRKTARPIPDAAKADMTRRRILVVDDNRDAATSLAVLLKLSGHETQTAYDGLEAVDAASSFKPDVALLDIGLPHLSGFEVARKIRAEPWGKSTVLIAVTGWGQDEDRLKSGEAGFDGHLIKPADFYAVRKLLAGLSASPK